MNRHMQVHVGSTQVYVVICTSCRIDISMTCIRCLNSSRASSSLDFIPPNFLSMMYFGCGQVGGNIFINLEGTRRPNDMKKTFRYIHSPTQFSLTCRSRKGQRILSLGSCGLPCKPLQGAQRIFPVLSSLGHPPDWSRSPGHLAVAPLYLGNPLLL